MVIVLQHFWGGCGSVRAHCRACFRPHLFPPTPECVPICLSPPPTCSCVVWVMERAVFMAVKRNFTHEQNVARHNLLDQVRVVVHVY